ncbi:pregnancy-specific beta-1-glycoprotein 9-like [Papio anubis]|uniref:pregnancy-specific beta-1-glycoprotein 9-like n=1 Tax=Papio anubis TaxID=9555 RepID=UPI0012AE9A5B|nr:pregnancy-specific beta-1-glycoprotein 9-like [Papio anubis]
MVLLQSYQLLPVPFTLLETPKPYISSSNLNPREATETVILSCDPDTQDVSYLWWINGQSLPISRPWQLSENNRILILYGVTKDIAGPYECEMKNPMSSSRSDPVTLNLIYTEKKMQPRKGIKGATQDNLLSVICTVETPKPYISSSNLNPREGTEIVILSCDPDTQDVSYLWWINGQSLPISHKLQLSENNRTLSLFGVTKDTAGPYECEMKNPRSSSRSDPVTLNLLFGLDAPTISSSYTYYHPGELPKLPCLTDSHPLTEHSWLIDGKFQQSAQVFFILQTTKTYRGVYVCFMHNSVTGGTNLIIKRIIVPGKWIPGALAICFPVKSIWLSGKSHLPSAKGEGKSKTQDREYVSARKPRAFACALHSF